MKRRSSLARSSLARPNLARSSLALARSRSALSALLCALVLPVAVLADPYEVGSVLRPLALEDQFGERHELDASVRAILFSREMAGGDVIKRALAENGSAILERHAAVYISDVSRMPGLVRRLFAKPSMRRRGYPMWLDERGEKTADLPSREGSATLILLDALRVQKIEYADSPRALLEALESADPE